MAVVNGHVNVIKYLLDHGANINSLHAHTFGRAARNGHSNVIDYIIKLSRKQNH